MGILKTGKITVLTVLATVLTAALLLGHTLTTVSAGNNNGHDNDDHGHQEDNHNDHDDNDHDDHDDHDNNHNNGHHATPTPSPRPTHRPYGTPVASATPSVTPTTVPTDPGITVVHDGKGDGLGCAVNDCSGNTKIEGYGTGGQVLGASTMAESGTFTENLYLAIMILGAGISYTGIKNSSKSKI